MKYNTSYPLPEISQDLNSMWPSLYIKLLQSHVLPTWLSAHSVAHGHNPLVLPISSYVENDRICKYKNPKANSMLNPAQCSL